MSNELTEEPLRKTGINEESQGNSSPNIFNEMAVKAFLEDNGLSHIICGNRQTPNGYEYRLGAKFINVFSASNFKNSNKSAVLLLTNHKIRVIRLEMPKKDIKTDTDFKSIAEPMKTSNNSI